MPDTLNDKRKIILEKIDNEDVVSIMELGLYELTPYFKEEFDVSLTEKIYINQNYNRRIKHENIKEIFFAPEQSRALAFIVNNRRGIVSAPTSFGKTLIVKEYIYLYNPNVVVYIVPTNALAYELETSFKNNPSFENYTIFDRVTKKSDVDVNDKLLFIGTQEKYIEIDEEWKNHIDLFVIDEAYKLEQSIDNQRAFVLSKVFLDSVIDKVDKTVLLTPIADLEGFDEYEFALFESNYNAVDRVFHQVSHENFYSELLSRSSNEKTLLFCQSPVVINEVNSEIEELDDNYNDSFISFLEDEIHPEWSVVKLLKKGVLTHHGQMPKFVQNKMINLYNGDSKYNLLIGTNSISEGINTVTKNVFIHPDYDVFAHRMLIKNTIGRAGRLGVYPLGHIFSTVPLDGIEERISIKLSISDEHEKEEVLSTLDEEKIAEIASIYNVTVEFLNRLIDKYNYSLKRITQIFEALKKDCKFSGLNNIPWMACGVFRDYHDVSIDSVIIRAFLQDAGKINGQMKRFERFNDRLVFAESLLKESKNVRERTMPLSDIIDAYMRFVYSNMEHKIKPIVEIGISISEEYNDWMFGKHVLSSINNCYNRYNKKSYGSLDFASLTEGQIKIIDTLKDYGMKRAIGEMTVSILNEIEAELNVRCSAFDIIQAFKRLSVSSKHSEYYRKMIHYYL